jgi:hypothetical protein
MKLKYLNETLNTGVYDVAVWLVNDFLEKNPTNKKETWELDASNLSHIPTLEGLPLKRKIIRIVWCQYAGNGKTGAAGPVLQYKNGEWVNRNMLDKERMKLKGRVDAVDQDLIVYTRTESGKQRSREALIDTVEHELNHVIDFIRSNGFYGNRSDKKEVDRLAAKEFGIDTTQHAFNADFVVKNKDKPGYENWKIASYLLSEKEFNQKINQLATIANKINKRPIFAGFDELICELYKNHGMNFVNTIAFSTSHVMTLTRSKIYKRYRDRIMREPDLASAYGNIFQDGRGEQFLSGKWY